VAGRGAGKTRAGACWVQHRVESGTMKLGCLISDHPRYAVHCAIDAGTSRTTAAVFFQVRGSPAGDRPQFTVFGDYLALDVFSLKNARAIQALADQLPCHGHLNRVRLDPAATARSSLGAAAYGEYERVFGS